MASRMLPETFRKLVVTLITTDFRKAVEVVTVPMLKPSRGEVLVRNRFAGVNASDINFTAGRYDPTKPPPFDAGFEGVGEIVAVGEDCQASYLKPGSSIAYIWNGAFAEYLVLPSTLVIPVQETNAAFVPLLVSGLTAAISLEKVGEIKQGETVLVTAAAGGTGQFAVQLAKQAGCHVIGTCSSDAKAEFLRSLGCDRAINYKKEELRSVLHKEYPNGLDVVYESVGGEMFDTCASRLAVKGRLILIGFITGYHTGMKAGVKPTLIPRLLSTSSSLRGFFLFNYAKEWSKYAQKLVSLYESGQLKSITDNGASYSKGPFVGIESISDAVDYLYTGKNQGKIIVEFPKLESKL